MGWRIAPGGLGICKDLWVGGKPRYTTGTSKSTRLVTCATIANQKAINDAKKKKTLCKL